MGARAGRTPQLTAEGEGEGEVPRGVRRGVVPQNFLRKDASAPMFFCPTPGCEFAAEKARNQVLGFLRPLHRHCPPQSHTCCAHCCILSPLGVFVSSPSVFVLSIKTRAMLCHRCQRRQIVACWRLL